ncbi:helix-turn-helix transcriptional regulator [Mycobacterium scrofulaceum]|uniref:Helix-turn-helix domain-containing protein n=1 Tax=Mycobacterium scrofulaceum TaxID=1783 RepID=A0A1X0K8M5_MYCSC|nr:hypothetical protein BST44_22755 [Mycobacterium scrofulaceum]
MDELISLRELAAYLGVPESTVYSWRCNGSMPIPGVRIGRRVMFRREDVKAWLDTAFANCIS